MSTRGATRPQLFSQARFVVLRTIYASNRGVSLRELAYRANVSVGAVQAALRSLYRTGHVTKKREGRRLVLRLNPQHPEFQALTTLFEFALRQEIRECAERDSLANKSLFINLRQMERFSRDLRRAAHGA